MFIHFYYEVIFSIAKLAKNMRCLEEAQLTVVTIKIIKFKHCYIKVNLSANTGRHLQKSNNQWVLPSHSVF